MVPFENLHLGFLFAFYSNCGSVLYHFRDKDNTQGDHSPDNVKFTDGSQHSSVALGMLSVTHIVTVLVLL